MKLSKIIDSANTKNNFQEACYFIYETIINQYGWDKAQAIFETIEQKYDIKLEY